MINKRNILKVEMNDYRCIDNESSFLPEYALTCWIPQRDIVANYANLCCNTSDYCNRNLFPRVVVTGKNTTVKLISARTGKIKTITNEAFG